jgi:hypothetical protein
MPVRPTIRCLREDLELPVPPARIPLDEIDHPLLQKAAEQFAAEDTPHERIRAIDDVVLFKVKTGRWRGAVYCGDPAGTEVRDWLVAAGTRKEGSPDDFCAALHADARTARQHYNVERDKALTTDTHTAHLLPGPDDHDRYLIEAAARLARRLNTTVRELVRGSLHDGHEHAADFAGSRSSGQPSIDRHCGVGVPQGVWFLLSPRSTRSAVRCRSRWPRGRPRWPRGRSHPRSRRDTSPAACMKTPSHTR